MNFYPASPSEFPEIRAFYWDLIDAMADANDTIGWKKGIYPTDEFLQTSLTRGELYLLRERTSAVPDSDTASSACDGAISTDMAPSAIPGSAPAVSVSPPSALSETGSAAARQPILASVILNSLTNEGYAGVPWSRELPPESVLIPHALGVLPAMQGSGIGKIVVRHILDLAQSTGKCAVRLDILNGNRAAEHLYTGIGFRYVAAKQMFYEDTGWTEYVMYEYNL